MKEIVILSGKGGTGKTSIAASFAVLASSKVLVDCDVDAPDLHLLLKPVQRESGEFWGMNKATIDPEVCTGCGLCADVCRFGAIAGRSITQSTGPGKDVYVVDRLACEGCGFCVRACPVQAARSVENLSGHWFISDTAYGPLVHARLGVAEENSGKLVATVKKMAREEAKRLAVNTIIVDGPPGIGCPVISSLSGACSALIITEPTLSGKHDMERAVGLAQHFGVPTFACINKFDIDPDNAREIERFCDSHGVPVLARVPFDDAVTDAIVARVPLVEYSQGRAAREVEKLWTSLERAVPDRQSGGN